MSLGSDYKAEQMSEPEGFEPKDKIKTKGKLMQIEIQVLNIEVTEHKTAKSSYKKADVAYKDLGSGKTQSKKIMSFGKSENAFLAIVSGGQGRYSVEMEKDGDYWVFTSASPSNGKSQASSVASATPSATPSSKFAEDKDKVQKYIVRQSSLKAAVDYFGNAGDKKVTVDKIVETAAKFEAYVFDEYVPDDIKPKSSSLPEVVIDEDDIKF